MTTSLASIAQRTAIVKVEKSVTRVMDTVLVESAVQGMMPLLIPLARKVSVGRMWYLTQLAVVLVFIVKKFKMINRTYDSIQWLSVVVC